MTASGNRSACSFQTHGFWLGVMQAALRGMSMVILLLAVDVAWPSYYGRKHLRSERGFGATIA